jgi:hypothetical protein
MTKSGDSLSINTNSTNTNTENKMIQNKLDEHLGKNFERRYLALKVMAVSLTFLFTVFYLFG